MRAEGMDELVRVARYGARIDTLRELAMLARAGIYFDAAALEDMAAACERATTPVQAGSEQQRRRK